MAKYQKEENAETPKIEPYPKQDWMEIRSDPELDKVIGLESYDKAQVILLWRILREMKKR